MVYNRRVSINGLRGSTIYFSLVCFLLYCVSVATAGNNTGIAQAERGLLTVAVAEFRTQGVADGAEWLGKSFADAMLTELSRSREVRVVERDFLEDILMELELQASALIDESSAVRVGRLLGARAFIFGTVSQFGNRLVVRARIVNVERGEVMGVAESAGELDQILAVQRTLAADLSQKMAIEAALIDITQFEVTPVSIAVYNQLQILSELAGQLPPIGLASDRQRRQAELQNALMTAGHIVSEADNFAQARYYRALFALHTEQFTLARQEMAIARRLEPQNPEFLLLAANISYQVDDIDEAESLLNQYTSLLPGDARGWFALGRIQMSQRKDSQASVSLMRALENSPYIYEAESNLRTLLSGPGGLALLDDLSRVDQKYFHSGMVMRSYWNMEQANIENLEIAVAAMPDIHILHYMRGLQLLRRSPSESKSSFQKSLNLYPGFPEGHRGLGQAYLRTGHCQIGKEHITIYLRLSRHVPDFSDLQREISRCS